MLLNREGQPLNRRKTATYCSWWLDCVTKRSRTGSTTLALSNVAAAMDSQPPPRRLPKIDFRVLIIGRANAGKTSILQRVCETTESPIIYRGDGKDRTEVRHGSPSFFPAVLISLPTRLNLTRPWMLVKIAFSSVVSNNNVSEASTRSMTNSFSPIIRVTSFTIHVESSVVAQKNSRFCRNLSDANVGKGGWWIDCMPYGLDTPVFTRSRLLIDHILRYCVPMDNQRPVLDLKFYKDICPDKNGAPSTNVWPYLTALWSSHRRRIH